MIYNDFNGKKLSALGMGNMRLPVIDGQDNKIDVELSKKRLHTAWSMALIIMTQLMDTTEVSRNWLWVNF